MSPEQRAPERSETNATPAPPLHYAPDDADPSFTVFDYQRSQRRSYYRQPSYTTASGSTAATGTGRMLTSPPSRPYTPSSDAGRRSIEAQIMEGGGMAHLGSRGIGRQLDGGSPIELSPQPSWQR